MKATIQDEAGRVVGVIDAEPTTFKTGNRGYRGVVKVSVNGKRYQAMLQLAEIRAKNKGGEQ